MRLLYLIITAFTAIASLTAQPFAPAVIIAEPQEVNNGYQSGVPVDFNADGLMDYLYFEKPEQDQVFYLLEQQTDGTFNRLELYETIDDTGILSALPGEEGAFLNILTTNTYYEISADGVFTPLLDVGNLDYFFGTADLNGDNRRDFTALSRNSNQPSGRYTLFLSQDDGSYNSTSYDLLGEGYVQRAIVCDLNDDGVVEAVNVQNGYGASIIELQTVPDIQDSILNNSMVGYVNVTIDIDNDGDRDLLFVQGGGNELKLWRQTSGGFPPFTEDIITLPSLIKEVEVFDYDNDGDEDIFIAKSFSAGFEIFLYDNLGGGQLGPPQTIYAINDFQTGSSGNPGQHLLEHADMDNDGDLDLIAFFTPGAFGSGNKILLIENLLLNAPNGITDNRGTTPMRVTPNPAEDFIVVTMENEERWSEFILYNMRGQQVCRWGGPVSDRQLDVSALSSGTYLLVGITERGKTHRARIVLQ